MASEILLFQAIVSIILGVLILVFPRMLNYIVALYLILVGVIALLTAFI